MVPLSNLSSKTQDLFWTTNKLISRRLHLHVLQSKFKSVLTSSCYEKERQKAIVSKSFLTRDAPQYRTNNFVLNEVVATFYLAEHTTRYTLTDKYLPIVFRLFFSIRFCKSNIEIQVENDETLHYMCEYTYTCLYIFAMRLIQV